MAIVECGACIYWEHFHHTETGEPLYRGVCHRRAPAPRRFGKHENDPDAAWPHTNSEDWCGEGETKLDKRQE